MQTTFVRSELILIADGGSDMMLSRAATPGATPMQGCEIV